MRRNLFFFLLSLAIVLLPSIIYATGIVPCAGPDCKACHLVTLGQNILTWFIGIMVGIVALAFAIGGFKMIMAGGDTGAVSSAREMMTNAVVGFVILLSAWLIVDTILKTFVEGADLGAWNEIKCVDAPARTEAPPAGNCSVQPLSPFSPEPSGVDWSNTDPLLQKCANKFTSLTGGSVTSAYRSSAYQTHLYETWSKWCGQDLQNNNSEECATVKASVSAEISRHSLSCSLLVAQTASNHGSGRAIDVTGINHGSPAVVRAAQQSCLVWFGSADRVHYTLQTFAGCSCS